MARRVLTTLVALPPLLLILWAGFPWLHILTALAALVGAREVYALFGRRGLRPLVLPGMAWALLVVAALPWESRASWVVVAGGPLILLLALAPRGRRGLSDWAATVLGGLYPGGLLAFGLLLRAQEDGLGWLLLALLATFATDSAAYLIGRPLGHRPLAPSISPTKTWEGALGGLLGGTAATIGLAAAVSLPMGLARGLLLGGIIGLLAQVGDLVESAMKRRAGVKDSGKLLPGHGGLLDRVDSVVFTLPLVYYYARWVR